MYLLANLNHKCYRVCVCICVYIYIYTKIHTYTHIIYIYFVILYIEVVEVTGIGYHSNQVKERHLE